MTTTAKHPDRETDAELLAEVGKSFFGRSLPSGGIAWQREMSRALGISVSQLQEMVAGRALTAANKERIAEWVAKAREDETKKSARRHILLRDLSRRVA